jgi:hypothetical protein
MNNFIITTVILFICNEGIISHLTERESEENVCEIGEKSEEKSLQYTFVPTPTVILIS